MFKVILLAGAFHAGDGRSSRRFIGAESPLNALRQQGPDLAVPLRTVNA